MVRINPENLENMILDGRKNYQYEYSALIAKRIYAQKLAKNKYAIGINGTSLHYSGLTKEQAEAKGTQLQKLEKL